MPESSISCSSCCSFSPPNRVGTNWTSSTSASPLSSLSSTSSSLARAYERRDVDAAASPRAAYSGASGVAGVVVVGGVIRIRARQRLAAPVHHPYRALRERVRVLVYALPVQRGVRHGGGRDERVRAVGGGVAGGVRKGAGRGEGGGGGRGRGVRGVGRAGALGRVGVGVGRGRQGAGGAGQWERDRGRGTLVLRRGEVRPGQRRCSWTKWRRNLEGRAAATAR
ncbi:hypothetical protein DFH08DRAFT_887458 [Mycena albidolilacea]|uniref:Uncharacterized protein n=1 Tax=Mycena albidolilacea TaxID=1033008 RepID=A0AAD6ZHX1_9AGAR|nr:hypothetical protein DFH08DRAFT_887458 [Mycena albidolilacea]